MFAGLTMLFLLSACEYDWVEPEKIPVDPGDTLGNIDTVSYAAKIQPIWDQGCNVSGCHSNSGFAPNLVAGKSYGELINGGYVNTGTPTESSIYKVMKTGSMSSYSTSTKNALVLKWIQQGAKNN